MGQEVVVLQDTATPAKRPESVPIVDPTTMPVVSPDEPTNITPVTQPKNAEGFPPEPSTWYAKDPQSFTTSPIDVYANVK
jgi:hypothetical protein